MKDGRKFIEWYLSRLCRHDANCCVLQNDETIICTRCAACMIVSPLTLAEFHAEQEGRRNRIEKILKSWYEEGKAAAPDHYEGGLQEEYNGYNTITNPYTFEDFLSSPLIKAAVRALEKPL